jgi:hypothetical protein
MADVLKVQTKARFKLTRNNAILYDQDFLSSEVAYTESAGARIVLATNTDFAQFDMEGVASGVNLMIESDRPVLVALGTTALYWPIGSGTKGGALILSGSAITNIYVKNESTENLATVHIAVTD